MQRENSLSLFAVVFISCFPRRFYRTFNNYDYFTAYYYKVLVDGFVCHRSSVVIGMRLPSSCYFVPVVILAYK